MRVETRICKIDVADRGICEGDIEKYNKEKMKDSYKTYDVDCHNFDNDEIYRLLGSVTSDCKDDGKSFQVCDRIEFIKKYLGGSSYELLAEDNLFLLYGKKQFSVGTSVVLVSSHIDCVYTRCFCEEQGDYYRGTFDNSFTNAVLLYAMKEEMLPENVVIAFTGDEEHDSAGAIAVNLYLTKKQNPIVFALVLDVTNVGGDENHYFAVENDFGIDLLTAHRIVEGLASYTNLYSYLHNAEPDESWDYSEYGIPCMTLSATVAGNMHSDEGVLVHRNTFEVYCNALQKVLEVLL